MKAVLTRCSSARVVVNGTTVGQLPGPGIVSLVGVSVDDSPKNVTTMARKIAELRILADPAAPTDPSRVVSAIDLNAPILVVSQFTLYGATAKGRRPSWSQAAAAPQAEPLIALLCQLLRDRGLHVETGQFGAMMQVDSINEGPFTVLVET